MIDKNNTVCIIPARGGSKGLPGKNIKRMAGKPLIAYSIEQALNSQYIDRILVSTDDEEIAGISRQYGAEVPFMRPAELAGDNASTIDVLLHAIKWMEEHERYDFDVVVLLHATAPLRNVGDIDSCIRMLVDTKPGNVFSVTESHRNPYFNMIELNPAGEVRLVKEGSFITRQTAPRVYDLNGSIYVWWKDILKSERKVFLKNSRVYVMPKERSIDIDDDVDFMVAELFRSNTLS